jgi:dTDP-glucose pyrophosphorylase
MQATRFIRNKTFKHYSKIKIKKKIVAIKKDTTSVIETISFAKKYIKLNEQVLICHPDNINLFFSKNELHKKLKTPNADGLLFAYDEDSQTNTSNTHTGRVIMKNGLISEIIEKTIKTKNSKTLAGIYHFSKWGDFLKYSKRTINNQPPIKGRHFVAQVYNEYLKDNKKILIFNIKRHITFGLVPYINEYNFWYKYFRHNIKKRLKHRFNFLNLIPSCGDGSRFLQNNKDNFKPLIDVDGKSMIAKTIDSLPKSSKNAVIIRQDHNIKYKFKDKIKKKLKTLM